MVEWLITGSKGQLGTDLQALLAGQEVVAVDLPECDVSDEAVARALVAEHRPRVLLNAAAYTNVDGAEENPDVARAANADAPGYLARACRDVGATLVHVSTDYVFAGDASEPYEVDAPVAPRSVYGRTKAEGERAVLDSGAKAYVVRTAWVYGVGGRNFIKTMCRLERERETVSVVDDQRGSPTWSLHLARGLLALVGADAAPGVYHCTGSGDTTWCGFARAIFEEIGADPERVRPITTAEYPVPAPRPAYSVLSPRAWLDAGLPPMPHWRDALAEAFATAGDAFRAG